MVDQLPNLGREKEMLELMGMSSIDDLFADIPEAVRMTEELPLPPPQSEEEIIADARRFMLVLGTGATLWLTNCRMLLMGMSSMETFQKLELPWKKKSSQMTKSKLRSCQCFPIGYQR